MQTGDARPPGRSLLGLGSIDAQSLLSPRSPRLGAPLAADVTPLAPCTKSASSPGTAVAGDGFLTFATQPWTHVSDGDRKLGDTPMVRIRLAPGTHNLRLVNEAEGIDTTRTVEIRAGETTTLKVKLK